MLLFIRLIKKNNNNNNRPINRVLKSLFAALSGTSASFQVGRIYTNTKEKYKRQEQKKKKIKNMHRSPEPVWKAFTGDSGDPGCPPGGPGSLAGLCWTGFPLPRV